jgi:hypothetical protein
MAERVKYLGIPMESATADLLARLDTEQRVPTSGLWLYAVVRALNPPGTIADTNDLYVILWMAVATHRGGGDFGARVSSDHLAMVQTTLKEAGIPSPVLVTDHEIVLIDKNYDDKHLISFFEDIRTFKGSSFASSHLLLTYSHEKTETRFTTHQESVVIGGAWRLYGGRKLTYSASEREKLIAILLSTMQPKTVVLGMNVVFDGKMKPLNSKISFSGTGGQIGTGDVLICHPDDLNRYTPLPGAVALVLGAVTEPVQAFTCPLPVGDEILTVVIK